MWAFRMSHETLLDSAKVIQADFKLDTHELHEQKFKVCHICTFCHGTYLCPKYLDNFWAEMIGSLNVTSHVVPNSFFKIREICGFCRDSICIRG